MKEQALFDTCWQAFAAGESLEVILERHPDQRQALEPMLHAAGQLQAVRTVAAPSAFRQSARARLLEQVNAVEQETSVPHAQRLAIWWHDLWASVARPLAAPAWAGAALALLFVLLFVTTTTYAAQAALPDDTLYPIKLASEQVWHQFAADSVDFDMTLAERRLQEALSLQTQNRHEAVPDALIRYQQSLGEWSERVEMAGLQDQGRAEQRLLVQLKTLQEMGEHAPAGQLEMLQEQQRTTERLMHRFAPTPDSDPATQHRPARTPDPVREQQTGGQGKPGKETQTPTGGQGTPPQQATPVSPTKKPTRTTVATETSEAGRQTPPGSGNQETPGPNQPSGHTTTPNAEPQQTPRSTTTPGSNSSRHTPTTQVETPTPEPSSTPEISPTAGPDSTRTPGGGGQGGGGQPTSTPGNGGQPGGGGSQPTSTPGSGGKN